MSKKIAIECEVSDETAARIETVAANSGKPVDWHVGRALEDYVAYHDFYMQKVGAGIAELDAGRGLSDGEVAKWIGALEKDPNARAPK